MLVPFLQFQQHLFHGRVQLLGELIRRAYRIDGSTDGDRDRSLGTSEPLRESLGPHPLRTPDDRRDDGNARLDGHARRTGLEFLDLEASTDGGLGVHTDELAFAQNRHSCLVGLCARAAIDGNVLQRPHDGAGDLVVEDLLLCHESDVPLDPSRGQSGVGEVEVTGVVDGDDRSPTGGDVLLALDLEFQALEGEYHTGDADDRSIDGFHSRLA